MKNAKEMSKSIIQCELDIFCPDDECQNNHMSTTDGRSPAAHQLDEVILQSKTESSNLQKPDVSAF